MWLNALMALRRKEPVKSILDAFGVPENHIAWCMAALGYPVAEGAMLEKRKDVCSIFIEEMMLKTIYMEKQYD